MGAMGDHGEQNGDPCRGGGGTSDERTFAFVLLFIVFFGCGGIAMISDSYFVRMLAAALAYTACVMIYGFARNKNGVPRYLFTCPVVVSQYPRLAKRHAVFLVVETAFLAIALRYFPLPPVGASRAEDGNDLLVAIPLGVLALVEIFMNRGVLERAHNERFGERSAPDDPKADRSLNIFSRDQ
jgi:hypothetical protein